MKGDKQEPGGFQNQNRNHGPVIVGLFWHLINNENVKNIFNFMYKTNIKKTEKQLEYTLAAFASKRG